MTTNLIRHFLLILGAGIVSSVLGGLFGHIVGYLSPDFALRMAPREVVNAAQYLTAKGAVWGLVLGACAMAFCIFVGALASASAGRREHGAERVKK